MGAERIDVGGFDEVYRVECGSTVAFVALHAVIRGRTFGGVRIQPYADEGAALEDALALARAMSRKVVFAGIPAGGAKVVLVEPGNGRREAVRRLGKFVESLEGRLQCGPDLGFTATDEEVLRLMTAHVARTATLGAETARGVLLALRTVADPEVVAIQGVGSVGLPLARALAAGGARVVAADIQPFSGFESVLPDAIYDVPCDVFAPCATNGVLDAATIPRLDCRVICGGANNLLASEEDADRLHERGILYVPDFLANAGAVIVGASRAMGEPEAAETRILAIADRVREVVAKAREEDRSPYRIAVEEADRRLAELRGGA